jgi:outer membrane protein
MLRQLLAQPYVRVEKSVHVKKVGIGCAIATLLCVAFGLSLAASDMPSSIQPLTLEETVRRVLERNESVQMRMLDMEISRRVLEAEKGIFEPAIISSIEHIDNHRPNNIREQRSLLTSELIERNNIYSGGLEFLSPIGSRFRLGVSLRDLRNNLQRQASLFGTGTNAIKQEYETFIGLSMVQPLLKNFGVTPTTARIRLAAAGSELAFQEYRRQMMLVVARAESAYWDLYLTQEQERISQESVGVAEVILSDNENRLQVGRSSELEVLQAEAGLALRRARRGEARARRFEGVSQLATFMSEPAEAEALWPQAIDEPVIRKIPLSYFESREQASQLNPDYLSRRTQVRQEEIRVAYSRNQRLPQLDLRASYGFNGLGQSVDESWDDIGRSEYPTWSVGVEMRIPVTGGVRERNEYAASKLARQRALVGLKEIEMQIGNALESVMHRVRSYEDNVQSYRAVVEFHEQLLSSQLERLKVGRIDSRTVLETEEKLFEARIAALENLVFYAKAFLELELVTGSTLLARNIELSPAQLKARTAANLEGRWSEVALERHARAAAEEYGQDLTQDTLRTRKGIDVLRRELAEREIVAQGKALEALREAVKDGDQPIRPRVENGAQGRALELLRKTVNDNDAQGR